MANKNRKRILPRNKNFTLDGDHATPYYKRLFRLVRQDDSMPVYRRTELTPELFMGLWGIERHMLKVSRIQDSLSNGMEIDWDQVESEIGYPEAVLVEGYRLLVEKYEETKPVLDQDFLKEVHDAICHGFSIVFPKPVLQIKPRTADQFYQRGTQRIFQSRYQEAIADFNRANEMEPNNPVFEYALSQYWLRYGGDNSRAAFWIERAILHLGNDNPLLQSIYYLLKTTITCALKRYEEATRSLQISTGALSFMVEKLEWNHGRAELQSGVTILGEGLRQCLRETIQASEQLIALVSQDLLGQVQSLLRAQRQLWKQL